MKTLPTLQTERLILRPFTMDDAADVQRLAGDPDVSKTTSNIPYPYEDGMAEDWISTHKPTYEKGTGIINLAITLKCPQNPNNTQLIGAISISIDVNEKIGELGYWIGKPFWNAGYGTEAAKAIMAYAFDVLELSSVHAFVLKSNPASSRILQKIGMQLEEPFLKTVEKLGKTQELLKYSVQNQTHN